MRDKVIVMTAAFYPEPKGVRFDLQCEQVRIATANGWPILISSGDHPETNEALASLGAIVVVQTPGQPHGWERRLLAQKALEIMDEAPGTYFGAIFQEEKPYLLEHLPAAIEHMKDMGAEGLIFNRSEASWSSWPRIQQQLERAANAFYNELLGVEGEKYDQVFGPSMFGRDGLEIYSACDPTVYGVPDTYPQLFAPLAIRAAGMYVTSLTITVEYPPAQRAEEEGDSTMMKKRFDQMYQITTGWGKAPLVHQELRRF